MVDFLKPSWSEETGQKSSENGHAAARDEVFFDRQAFFGYWKDFKAYFWLP